MRLGSYLSAGPVAAKKAQGKQLGNPKLVAAATKRDKVLRPILQKLDLVGSARCFTHRA
jgi:hypothetical protein